MARNNSNKNSKSKKFKSNRYKGQDANDRRDRENSSSGSRKDDFINGSAGSNDPAWWNRTGQIAKDSASFAFQGANGAQLRGFEAGRPYFTAPGVMVLDYVPTLGTVRGATHPVNVAARLLYDKVNSKNSRTPSYDPSDLEVYIIALANAWSLHSWTRRVVGTYNTFDPENRYWPKALRSAMGCAPDLSDQLIVAWRQVANWMATRLNIFNVPADIPYFQRAIFMNNAVYSDMASSKASYFMFNPRALFRLVDRDTTDPTRVGGLVYEEFPSNVPGGITPEILWNYFEKLTAPLFNDSIIPTISADIEKAFGIGGCFRLPNIDDSEMTVPVYNPEMLMQINNARFYPYKSVDMLLANYAVRQNMESNTLNAELLVDYAANDDMGTFYARYPELALPINFPIDNPSVDATIEATRLMWAIDPGSKTGSKAHVIGTTSTEILVDSYIFTYDTDENNNDWTLHTIEHPQELIFTDGVGISTSQLNQVRAYLQFGWAPIFQAYIKNGTSAVLTKSYLWSDIYNYSTLVFNDLKVLNDACYLSIMGVV